MAAVINDSLIHMVIEAPENVNHIERRNGVSNRVEFRISTKRMAICRSSAKSFAQAQFTYEKTL
jgi:hypothetical protein